jgi:hypothetical protein
MRGGGEGREEGPERISIEKLLLIRRDQSFPLPQISPQELQEP